MVQWKRSRWSDTVCHGDRPKYVVFLSLETVILRDGGVIQFARPFSHWAKAGAREMYTLYHPCNFCFKPSEVGVPKILTLGFILVKFLSHYIVFCHCSAAFKFAPRPHFPAPKAWWEAYALCEGCVGWGVGCIWVIFNVYFKKKKQILKLFLSSQEYSVS